MGFKKDAYATIWAVQNRGAKFAKVRLSTSHRSKDTNQYETDFSGFVSLIGDAFRRVDDIESVLASTSNGTPRCKIKINSCDVTNKYDKAANREYTNFTIYSLSLDGEEAPTADLDAPVAPKAAAPKAAPAPKAKAKAKTKADPLATDPLAAPEDSNDEDLPF
jgi:hypothetical protein